MFWADIWKLPESFIWKFLVFGEFLIYLNRCVFVICKVFDYLVVYNRMCDILHIPLAALRNPWWGYQKIPNHKSDFCIADHLHMCVCIMTKAPIQTIIRVLLEQKQLWHSYESKINTSYDS